MNLENQVCSLESSKRLKELGVKQESLFFWITTGCEKCTEKNELIYAYKAKGNPTTNCYSAFTVAELGEMLPTLIQADTPSKSDIYLQYFKAELWVCSFITMPFQLTRIATAENEADARAKMLIYLLENNLMEL